MLLILKDILHPNELRIISIMTNEPLATERQLVRSANN
jgi:hypothetical protein